MMLALWQLPLLLAGCVTHQPVNRLTAEPATTRENVGRVINQPIQDLNLSNSAIPALLRRAEANPYLLSSQPLCSDLQREIDALTFLLGPDLGVRASSNATGRTVAGAETAAWGAARSAADSWIPFRGVVRWVTGAERKEQEAEYALVSGFARRAYLKGFAAAQGCAATAQKN
jgi:hypothetical protein